MSLIQVQNQNILITGGANGIGRELVKKLYELNTIYVVDRDLVKLSKLKEEFPNIHPFNCDLSDWESTRATLEAGLPPVIHGLVNNAGIGAEGSFLHATQQGLNRVIAVNTRAVVNVSQIVANRFIKWKSTQKNSGDTFCSIVNVSSLAAKFPTRVSLAYNITKAAVDSLTKGMALELGPHRIRVNAVNPNIVMGTDLATAWVGAAGGQLKDKLLARTPLQRVVDVKDVVNTIVFLFASTAVGMIHGETLLVDGGYSVM